jgi:UDP-sugar pyrophosphorylase
MEGEIEQALTITRNCHQPKMSAFLQGPAAQSAKENLAKDIFKFEKEYPGGLVAYHEKIVTLMEEFIQGKTKYDNVELKVPPTVNLDWDHLDDIRSSDLVGIPSMKKCAFFLLAGGLGERLGYNGTKACMNLDSVSGLSYVQLYCEYIMAYQTLFGTFKLIVSS